VFTYHQSKAKGQQIFKVAIEQVYIVHKATLYAAVVCCVYEVTHARIAQVHAMKVTTLQHYNIIFVKPVLTQQISGFQKTFNYHL